MLIYESLNFVVESPEEPLVSRADGGHITINPKLKVVDRQQLTPKQAVELMRLTMVTGLAMTRAMNKNGIDIGRINYQDNGNWGVFTAEGPFMHVHLYGRAKNAKVQKYGEACFFPHKNEDPGFYEGLEPLRKEDVKEIRSQLLRLMKTKKYSTKAWRL